MVVRLHLDDPPADAVDVELRPDELQRDAGRPAFLDEAVKLAERIVEDAEKGRVDLGDLGRRARHLLEATSKKETEPLF